MEEKNGTYYKSNHGLLLQLRSLVWDKNVIAPKSGKIYVLLRLLVKHWIQDPDIFHCLINYMIYHMSFPSAQFLFIDSNVRDVTWHKSYPEMATIQFYSDGYVNSVLNCEAILLLITCSFFHLLSRQIRSVRVFLLLSMPMGWLFTSLILFCRCQQKFPSVFSVQCFSFLCVHCVAQGLLKSRAGWWQGLPVA